MWKYGVMYGSLDSLSPSAQLEEQNYKVSSCRRMLLEQLFCRAPEVAGDRVTAQGRNATMASERGKWRSCTVRQYLFDGAAP
jgi:hypothetical protein